MCRMSVTSRGLLLKRDILDSKGFDDLVVGLTAARRYEFTAQRVGEFADLVEDPAPVHSDENFAKQRGFGGRIVHGLFVQSIISGMLGNDVPGANSVINNLSMKMHNPVLVGECVDYRVEIVALTAAVRAVSINFEGKVNGVCVISGKALCSFPRQDSA
jgi:acyl dehydratase